MTTRSTKQQQTTATTTRKSQPRPTTSPAVEAGGAGAAAGNAISSRSTDRTMVGVLDRDGLREVAEADQLIAALSDAFPTRVERPDRRKEPRYRYQVRARLELVGEDGRPVESAASHTVHTRDLSSRGTGFVTSSEVAGDARGVLHLPPADGTSEPRRVACRVRRTREAGNGWFEGVVEFETPTPVFSSTRIGRAR